MTQLDLDITFSKFTRHPSGVTSVVYTDSEGRFHRTDGPAIEWSDGNTYWYQHGCPHRTDGPARIHSNGTCEYWQDGKRHRTDGPAVEIFSNKLWDAYCMTMSDMGISRLDDVCEYWIDDVQVQPDDPRLTCN